MVKRKSSGGGSTLYGVLAGLLIGLVAAVVVAFYVIKSPMPFVDKASRSPEASSAASKCWLTGTHDWAGDRTELS